jgi:hypothetical protein
MGSGVNMHVMVALFLLALFLSYEEGKGKNEDRQ